MFARFSVHDWRQFDNVDLEFGERLTVLTGANGAGKTTILNILGQHFGWALNFVSTPRMDRRGLYRYWSGFRAGLDDPEPQSNRSDIGLIEYRPEGSGVLWVQNEVSENFQVRIDGQHQIPGIFLPSHRPAYSYLKVSEIPTQVDASQQLFDNYVANLRQFYTPNARVRSPSHQLKAALISLATFGYGNRVVRPNEQAIRTFEGFESILKRVLPEQLEFHRIAIRLPDVVFECGSGDFSLDAASGGISAIVDIAWQIHMRSEIDEHFVVLADELENHLHPELQRSLLPGLVDAFPQAQFIVATHNPFMVTSVPDSTVYVLSFEDGRVISQKLSDVDRAGSADDILMDVLGVRVPIAIWAEREIDEIVAMFESTDINQESLTAARDRLVVLGLADAFPSVLDRVLSVRDD